MVDVRPRSYGEGLGEGANSVLGKARLILEAFRIDDADLSLSELARRTGISKASVYRLAQELLDWGMLERSGQDYRLGMRAFELGSRVPRFRVLRDTVRPLMESVHFATKETVHLAVLDGLDVLYLEKVAGGPQATKPSQIAGRMPLHSTATGKVLLAHAPASVFDDVIARGLTRQTPATIVMPGMLAEQLRTIRERGYAVEQEETTAGYVSVAVPLMGSSGIVLASVSITAPVFRADVPRYVKTLTAISDRVAALDQIN
ncbi:IclR family transcriptional regulator [Nocardioides sp. CER19]|uniref:IclR family transcriptional regulator n=1 Tax=Nocardioides sp. CER19 TaxID=3038538 RepID=UPI00244C9DC2|nr:IclR family transcriptional regulator [Nocardioides sp. CER19]MDH2414367.1 IclR family transcriptional regulator [Nocardioides sp. CER19]